MDLSFSMMRQEGIMTETADAASKAKKSRIRKGHWIPVVAGFLRKDGKILVGQRPENNSLPGQWEYG